MSESRDRIWLLAIGLYVVFFCVMWSRFLPSAPRASGQTQVLGAATVIMPEASGMPSLNTLLAGSNAYRTDANVAPLQVDDVLMLVAQSRANDMAKRNYYAHKNPDGMFYYDMFKQTEFEETYSCENLSLGSSLVPHAYLNQWLASNRGHRECLLNPVTTRVGYGVAQLSAKGNSDSVSFIVVAIQAAP